MKIILLIIAHIFVGLFLSSFMEEHTSGGNYEWLIFFWPVFILGLIFVGMLLIPIKLGKWLAEVFGQWF